MIGRSKAITPENWNIIYPLLKPYLPDDGRYIQIVRHNIVRSDINGNVNFVGNLSVSGTHIVNTMHHALRQIQAVTDSPDLTLEEKIKFITHILKSNPTSHVTS